MKHKYFLILVGASAGVAACAHRSHSTGPDPVALAGVRADLRLVDGETTWVAHGSGYELVGRTRADILALQPALDRDAATFRRVFSSDSVPSVVVTVRR